MHRLTFPYNLRGRGVLRLYDGDREVWAEPCRTGSIDADGLLVNGLPGGRWYLCTVPTDTDEPAMVWPGEPGGWKCRLYRHDPTTDTYTRTHYLIHPDGGKNGGKDGTRGCIGTQTSGAALRAALRSAIDNDRPAFVPLDTWRE
jgi:hypothetical protein